MFRNTVIFYGQLLASRGTPKLEDHPLSVFRDSLFSVFAATVRVGGRSSIRSMRTRHALVTGTHLSSVSPTQLHLLRQLHNSANSRQSSNWFYSYLK